MAKKRKRAKGLHIPRPEGTADEVKAERVRKSREHLDSRSAKQKLKRTGDVAPTGEEVWEYWSETKKGLPRILARRFGLPWGPSSQKDFEAALVGSGGGFTGKKFARINLVILSCLTVLWFFMMRAASQFLGSMQASNSYLKLMMDHGYASTVEAVNYKAQTVVIKGDGLYDAGEVPYTGIGEVSRVAYKNAYYITDPLLPSRNVLMVPLDLYSFGQLMIPVAVATLLTWGWYHLYRVVVTRRTGCETYNEAAVTYIPWWYRLLMTMMLTFCLFTLTSWILMMF